RIKWWQRFNLERRENHVQPEERQHRPANQRSESGPFRDDDVADDEANKRQNHMKKTNEQTDECNPSQTQILHAESEAYGKTGEAHGNGNKDERYRFYERSQYMQTAVVRTFNR